MTKEKAKKAVLALEDGRIFEGDSFGADGERAGEVVFNTGMTGYQEVLTDPSYRGQIVTMTYPLIGNYGINEEDFESEKLWLEGFIVRELSSMASNHRATGDLASYLKENAVMGIEGIDTRALTKHIREAGAMKAILSTEDDDRDSLMKKLESVPDLVGRDLVRDVGCAAPYVFARGSGPLVIVLDCGVKTSILRQLEAAGCRVSVVPAETSDGAIAAMNPDGVLVSNGPGDPSAVQYAIDTIRALIFRRKLPLFGICLGQQLIALALGGRTYKLKFGHHGANHPVQDLKTGGIDITVQNHGFCVDIDSLDSSEVEITHVNLNDGTCEGFRHRRLPVFSVQFHPEAGPGPHDSRHLFGRFVEMLGKNR